MGTCVTGCLVHKWRCDPKLVFTYTHTTASNRAIHEGFRKSTVRRRFSRGGALVLSMYVLPPRPPFSTSNNCPVLLERTNVLRLMMMFYDVRIQAAVTARPPEANNTMISAPTDYSYGGCVGGGVAVGLGDSPERLCGSAGPSNLKHIVQ